MKSFLLAIVLLLGTSAEAATFTVLHSFSELDGSNARGSLIIDAGGNLFGTTTAGGWGGTIYRLSGAGFVTPGGGVIPEPATWAMLIAGFGLVGAGLRIRRRREADKRHAVGA